MWTNGSFYALNNEPLEEPSAVETHGGRKMWQSSIGADIL